jgi:hypothetical protein
MMLGEFLTRLQEPAAMRLFRRLPPTSRWPLETIYGSVMVAVMALGAAIAVAVILGWRP